MTKRIFGHLFALALFLGLFAASALAQVDVREEQLDIPTYYIGPDDPNPPLWNERVYPYPMQTELGDTKEMKKHRAVIMENRYIRVIILPDLGGRILTAHDKTNGNFDFIYHNHVFKPAKIGLRGVWMSGGMEWNFPTLGHTVDTMSPVNYKIIRNEDDSVTCVVGTEEWVRRMKWEVFITLPPERSYFKATIRLFNGTPTHNNGYYWTNAAAHAWEDTLVIFPPTKYTYFGKRRQPMPWPIRDGLDVSWYANTERSSDYFCGVAGDYLGAYNYEKDNGTVHCGSRYDSPGHKFWTWGTAPRGKLWEKLLTDEDGGYIEIQVGRLLTQGDTWIFEPHMVEQWDEYWYPVKGMKGFVEANRDAAVNLAVGEKKILIALNVTCEFKGGRIALCAEDGRELFGRQIDVSPEGAYSEEIANTYEPGTYLLKFFDTDGREVISYSTAEKDIPAPELQPDMYSDKSASAEADFLRGYYYMKDWNREAAVRYFESALKKDPGFTQAHTWLGIMLYKAGATEKALEHFNSALARNEDEHSARYYRALCKLRLGITERTEEDLYMVGRRAAYRHVAPYLLAGIEIGKGNVEKAMELLRLSIKENPQNPIPKVILAVVSYKNTNSDEGEFLLREVLETDPINAAAIIANRLLLGRDELQVLRENPQIYIETALLFAQSNLFREAVDTLKLFVEIEPANTHPLVFYYLWYFSGKASDGTEAGQWLAKAAAGNPDYVLPVRPETEEVLKAVAAENPRDWKALYYLGNLLTANLRWQEGLEYYRQAAALSPEFSVLYRNMGQVYWYKAQNLKRAEKRYWRAIKFAPNDHSLYVDLDKLLFLSRDAKGRERLHDSVPEAVRDKELYTLSRAQYMLDSGRCQEALDTLKSTKFRPWEGDVGFPREVYHISLLSLADQAIDSGEYEKAHYYLTAAMEYPEHLGTESPSDPVFSRELYLLGLCREKQGDQQAATEYYEKAASGPGAPPSEQVYYQALALRHLGKEKEAQELAENALKQCDEITASSSGPAKINLMTASALLHHFLGNYEEGKKLINQVVQISPINRWAIYFSKRLFSL
jgi:tetratricopeptide (TPR) repeat protein